MTSSRSWAPPGLHLEVALSRDGARAASVRSDGITPPGTWVFDLARESSRRLRAPIFSGGATVSNHYWDVSPDGQRFLIAITTADDPSAVLTVVLNWQSGLSADRRN